MVAMGYSAGWKRHIRDTIYSGIYVYGRLQDDRDYHESRSSLSFDDYENRAVKPGIEIPLLWGTF